MSEPPELELPAAGSRHVGAGNGSFARAVVALSPYAIPLALYSLDLRQGPDV